MAGPATLKIEVVSDSSVAIGDMGQISATAASTAADIEKMGTSFDDVDRKSAQLSDVAGKVDEVGGSSSKTAGALGDLGGVFDLLGNTGLGDKLGIVGTVLMGAAGAADLFTVATELLNIANLKSVASTIARTTATIATTVATGAVTVATNLWTAAQWLLNIALNANPIGLIVAGILILIGVVILIVKHWQDIEAAADSLWTKIREVWDLIVDKITHNPIVEFIQKIIDKIQQFIDMLSHLDVGKILGGIGDAIGGIFGRSATPELALTSSRVFRLVGADALARATPTGPSTLAETASSLASRAAAPVVLVNVWLDNRRVEGFVDSVVATRLDEEGARMAAGVWSP